MVHFSFVDVASLVRSLRALLLHSCPLRATDVSRCPPRPGPPPSAPRQMNCLCARDFLLVGSGVERDNRLAPLQAAL